MLPVREDLEGAVERRRTGSEEKHEDEDEDEEEEDGHSFAKANIARYLSNVRGNTCGPYSYRTVQGTSLGGRGGWRKWGGGLGVSRWREGEGGGGGEGEVEKTKRAQQKHNFPRWRSEECSRNEWSFPSVPLALFSSSDRMFVFRKIDRNETPAVSSRV